MGSPIRGGIVKYYDVLFYPQAVDPEPAEARPAAALRFEGKIFVPGNPPSRFLVGPGTWFKDESGLLVRDFGDYVIVSAPDDPQILFPRPEHWIRANRFTRLLEDGVVSSSEGQSPRGDP